MLEVLLFQKDLRRHFFVPYSQSGGNGITNRILDAKIWRADLTLISSFGSRVIKDLSGMFCWIDVISLFRSKSETRKLGIWMFVKILTHQLHEILRGYLREHSGRGLRLALGFLTHLIIVSIFLSLVCWPDSSSSVQIHVRLQASFGSLTLRMRSTF